VRLSSFHSLHPAGFSNVDQAHQTQSFTISCILKSDQSQSNLRSLPAAPFFVAAVLEAIASSKFVNIVEVVPGEADAYCAAKARLSGGTVLTNDSDLLIYDLGPDGTVGSLNGLEFITNSNISTAKVCVAAQTKVINPRDVARSLGLKDLKDLAYVLKEHPESSFQKAAHEAQHIKLNGAQYQQTLGEYLVEPAAFESRMFQQDILTRVRTQTPFLDPRISEFVLQSDSQSASIYLPIMIEDPTRTSAFAASISQRLFAYSCCTFPSKVPGQKVLEYGRKGQRILPTSIELLSDMGILKHARSLRIRLQKFMTIFSDLPKALIWRIYALAEVYHWYLDTARTPPSRDAMITALTGKTEGRITWDDIHLYAQIEATLYSLRMTQQILAFVLPFNPSDEIAPSVMQTLIGLQDDLNDLPLLKILMPSRCELSAQTVNVDVDEMLNSLANIIQDDVSQEGLVNGMDGKNDERADTRKRKRKRGKRAM
jgi:hypothetical protein